MEKMMLETKRQVQTSTKTRYLPIEEYGMVGDLTTVALVGKNGSIDWCCLPDFDAPGVFGALLDADKGGFFRLAPTQQESLGTKQMYFPETNILITDQAERECTVRTSSSARSAYGAWLAYIPDSLSSCV